MKKKLLILHSLFLFSYCAFSQGIGIGTNTPNASAALDITATNKGILVPRMNISSINAIANPARGLLVYDSAANQLMVNTGTPAAANWKPVVPGVPNGWNLSGNSHTNSVTQFIGTTDDRSLRFRINNTWAGELNIENSNVSLGLLAGAAITTGTSNTAIGAAALRSNTEGTGNVAAGASALNFNTTGFGNTAVGNIALLNNTTGNGNTAVGDGSLAQNTGSLGQFNTAVGEGALFNTTSAEFNTAVGYHAGTNFLMGFNNTILGANCDANQDGLFNIIAIGQDVTCTANNQARIGNAATNSIGGFANWTNISDGRYKKNIQEAVKGIDFIMKLRPVTYQLDISGISNKLNESRGRETNEFSKRAIAEKEKIIFSGFVAQEVEQAAKDVNYDFSGVDKPKNENDFYGLRYAEFVVPLVKAMQEQQQIINELRKRLDELEKKAK
jgi:trimeric autotransporter adhesin